ncbi:hypothetical protein [Prochlorococcus marinus]|uniref:Uncharacterized protein n=1 Tax=Prochlorococcus marinus (strain MIT 9211) TaxID=93059 RepID=A9BBX9_PROM4|nr:hypothetical protein [Prochlorococcus marinus]ABX09341.1 conserved hypothetical protein [Prochlorococcus marinus str. MIT 9211]
MTISILVLKKAQEAFELAKQLRASKTQITKFELIEPLQSTDKQLSEDLSSIKTDSSDESLRLLKSISINDVKLLNPKITRKERQRSMSLWLMPFGLIAGITFAGMTNLKTFSDFGFGPIGETIFGGFLGMLSGWIGSFFAAASVNTYQEDVKALRKRHEQGYWLVVLQTPSEIQLPWELIQGIQPIEVVSVNEL